MLCQPTLGCPFFAKDVFMKYFVLTSLFALLVLLLSACSTQSAPALPNNETFIETQEFILSPGVSTSSLTAASISATTPRLLVRLSIKPELSANGTVTGKRYGQVEFYWTDKARSKGGSNLGGIASIMLRDANTSDIVTEFFISASAPIMSNIDLYRQPGYEDHIVKTVPISHNAPLCVEVSSLNLMSTNGYLINHTWELTDTYNSKPMIRLCDKKSNKSGVDLRLAPLKNRMFEAASGGEFTLPMAVINSGSDIAQNVTVGYRIPFAEELTFVRNTSSLFTCTASTQQTSNEGLVMNVTCSTPKLSVGIKTLPLVFSSTKEAAIYSGLFEFYMNISTSSTETDTTNNTSDSFVIVY
jgi:hypothetical protein